MADFECFTKLGQPYFQFDPSVTLYFVTVFLNIRYLCLMLMFAMFGAYSIMSCYLGVTDHNHSNDP